VRGPLQAALGLPSQGLLFLLGSASLEAGLEEGPLAGRQLEVGASIPLLVAGEAAAREQVVRIASGGGPFAGRPSEGVVPVQVVPAAVPTR
jgi:hypothetical protein